MRGPDQSDPAQSARQLPLRVMVATPLGRNGKGGMDRIADLIMSHIETRPEFRTEIVCLTTKGGLSKIRGAFVFAAAIARLVVAAARGQIDVLHINLAAYGSVYRKAILALIARGFSIPYVVHVHSGRFGDFWSAASPVGSSLVERLLRASRHIVVLGKGFEALVLERLPEVAGKLSVVPNATVARTSAPRSVVPGRRKQITYLGLIAPKKGVPELVAALAQLSERDDWTATIAGHGDVEGMRNNAVARGIGDRLRFPGWIGPQDVDQLLAETDIFVLPSYSEGLSMAVLEAFAAGAAVITTPVNAMVEVIEDGRNGLFVTPGDVEGLAGALSRLLDDDGLRRRLGSAALDDHRSQYAIAPYVERLVAIWSTAASRDRRRVRAPADASV